jgi:co-chaperonin GroES (HSP10)
LIRRDEEVKQTKGGILLPDSQKISKNQTGTVEAVGPEVKDLTPGMRVVILAYAGSELNSARKPEEFVIVKEEDVLAVLADEGV